MMASVPEAPRIKHIEDIPPLPAAASATGSSGASSASALRHECLHRRRRVQLIEEHDETGSGAGGHEELYVVIAGHARFSIDGIEHDAPAGTLVFIPDPTSRRTATALVDGTTALGGRRRARSSRTRCRRGSRRSPPRALADAGDPGAAADLMQEALAEHPGNAHVLYNTACFEALAGRRDDAIAHLRAAVELAPEMRDWAAEDSDFDSIRDDPSSLAPDLHVPHAGAVETYPLYVITYDCMATAVSRSPPSGRA